MPPNKKKSSSKKKGKKKDTDEAKKAWAVEGRIDARGLAKALPETARGLKSGDVSVNDAAVEFAGLALGDRMKEFRMLPFKKNPKEVTDWVLFACYTLAGKVLPRSSSQELQLEFAEHLVKTLMLHRHDATNARRATDFYATALQTTFDQVATEWEPRIRRTTRRQLTETCDVYKISREAFLAYILDFLEENFDTSRLRVGDDEGVLEEARAKHEEMSRVAGSLACGDDEVVRTCWCCGKHDRTTSHCSKCHAARYCSRDCQVKSWKEGHKNVCADLKTAYEGFTNDLKRVDKALEEGVAGIQPTARFDYQLVVNLLQLERILPPEVFISLPRPSMDALYQNLAYIIRGGDHWLFEDTPNPSFAQGSFTKGSVRPVTVKEVGHCRTPLAMLACDISSLPENKRNTFKKTCLVNKHHLDPDGCNWTAKRLLQIYSTVDSITAPSGTKETRTDCVIEAVKWFRETYTKSGE